MLRLCFGLEEEADVLDLTLSAHGSAHRRGRHRQSRSCALDRTGSMLGEQHLRWGVDWTRTTQADGLGAWEIRAAQTNADTGAEMLVISGTLTECVPEVCPGLGHAGAYVMQGSTSFLCMRTPWRSSSAMFRSPSLPLCCRCWWSCQRSSYQSIFQLLEQYGVMDVLTAGLE